MAIFLMFSTTGIGIMAQDVPNVTNNKVDGLELPADLTVDYNDGYINVEAKTTGDQVDWIVLSDIKIKYEKKNDKALTIGLPKIETSIIVYAISNPATKLAHVKMVITIKGPAPPSVTTPPVTTPPVTTPSAQPINKLHVTFIIDTSKVTEEQAQILNSPTLRKSLLDNGHVLRILDFKSPQLAAKKLDGFVKNEGGPPVLIIQTVDGVVKYSKTTPKAEAEILLQINSIAGIAK